MSHPVVYGNFPEAMEHSIFIDIKNDLLVLVPIKTYRICCALQAHEKTRLWRHIESVITDMDPSQLKVQSSGYRWASLWHDVIDRHGSGHMFFFFCGTHVWPICFAVF